MTIPINLKPPDNVNLKQCEYNNYIGNIKERYYDGTFFSKRSDISCEL